MRVQVSARSGTMTPNSSEPKRVRVAGSACRRPLISWSMESPLAQPAGVSEPPWMLPGNSSMPVSRQPMPRMWPSPSPRMRSLTPRRNSVRSRNGSSGVMLALRVNLAPISSGQKAGGMTPLGLNIMTSRCLRFAWLANARLGRLSRNGNEAAPMPRSRMNSRRLLVPVMFFLRVTADGRPAVPPIVSSNAALCQAIAPRGRAILPGVCGPRSAIRHLPCPKRTRWTARAR